MTPELKKLLEIACNITAKPEFVHKAYSYELVATISMDDWNLIMNVLNALNMGK